MKTLVLDGYTDEPACLGVPPFISPNARLVFGAAEAAGAEVEYATIDQWRRGSVGLRSYDLVAVVRNVAVPGKYIRGMPASDRELVDLVKGISGTKVASLGSSPKSVPGEVTERFDHVSQGDLDASVHDLLTTGEWNERRRTQAEWNSWLLRGAGACLTHPDHGGPLIAEVQMYRGCVRYLSGGCDFCVEPLFGEVRFRRPKDILEEMTALSVAGVRNFRLGAQSCVYCYMSKEVGESETPTPNPNEVEKLLSGAVKLVNPEVLHVDNANPAVIAEHPIESREVTKSIAEHCTSGNVLAFGLESADPVVLRSNNLNATAEQTLASIKLVNGIGAVRGPTGLPRVLPGINFVCGLKGESRGTYQLNLDFLKKVVSEGLLLRRINIRQVMPVRDEFPGVVSRADFERFKREVRKDIDGPLLQKLVPDRTVLTGVYTELREGGRTFGRQVGTYPLLISIPYPVELGARLDVAVTGRGFRSVEGVTHPMNANTATLSMLRAVPGIGARRAGTIVRRRPFAGLEPLMEIFDEPKAQESARFHLSVGNVDRTQ